jgi:asparagine N-glycosylation enzyme membrane subunit Stt3
MTMNTTSQPAGAGAAGEGRGERLARAKETVRRFGEEARDELRKPTTGAAVAGAAIVGAAVVWGAAEAAIGAVSAYVVYRILKRRESNHRYTQ